jgi:hypothetical protein
MRLPAGSEPQLGQHQLHVGADGGTGHGELARDRRIESNPLFARAKSMEA